LALGIKADLWRVHSTLFVCIRYLYSRGAIEHVGERADAQIKRITQKGRKNKKKRTHSHSNFYLCLEMSNVQSGISAFVNAAAENLQQHPQCHSAMAPITFVILAIVWRLGQVLPMIVFFWILMKAISDESHQNLKIEAKPHSDVSM
jgi:hypothetical protein